MMFIYNKIDSIIFEAKKNEELKNRNKLKNNKIYKKSIKF